MSIRRVIVLLACGAVMNWVVAWVSLVRWGKIVAAEAAARPTMVWPRARPVARASWSVEVKRGAEEGARFVWPSPVPEVEEGMVAWAGEPLYVNASDYGWVTERVAGAWGPAGVERCVSRTEVGWPWRSLWSSEAFTHPTFPMAGAAGLRRVETWRRVELPGWWGKLMGVEGLPWGVRWWGLVGNSVVYAAALWVMGAGAWRVRAWRRRRRGLCARCAYPVGVSAVCTECGGAVRSRVPKSTDREDAVGGTRRDVA